MTAGPCVAFATGAGAYVIAYAIFAAGLHGMVVVALGFALAGAGIGLAEPTQLAVVSQLLPDGLRGSGFGARCAVEATGAMVATVVVGLLYTVASPAVAPGYAAAWMTVAVVASGMLRPQ